EECDREGEASAEVSDTPWHGWASNEMDYAARQKCVPRRPLSTGRVLDTRRPHHNFSRMRWALRALVAAPLLAANGQPPLADHHQHFFSPSLLEWAAAANPALRDWKAIGAKELVAFLDSAGIRRAVVLAAAFP